MVRWSAPEWDRKWLFVYLYLCFFFHHHHHHLLLFFIQLCLALAHSLISFTHSISIFTRSLFSAQAIIDWAHKRAGLYSDTLSAFINVSSSFLHSYLNVGSKFLYRANLFTFSLMCLCVFMLILFSENDNFKKHRLECVCLCECIWLGLLMCVRVYEHAAPALFYSVENIILLFRS